MEAIAGFISLALIILFYSIIFGLVSDKHHISSLASLILYLEHKVDAIYNSRDYLRASYYYKLSIIKHKEGDCLGALRALDEVLDDVLRGSHYLTGLSDGDYVNAYYTRGTIRGNLQNYEGAVSDYNEAIRLNSNFKEVYFPRALNHMALGKVEKAIDDLQKASSFFYSIGNSVLGEKAKDMIKAIQENPGSINKLI